jgi:DNA-binding transcriptional ArsR family regulator
MERSAKRVDDLATLRAVAHPLRMRLLGALRIDGPATASELGRRFDESSGATSYHLRQLERYGFVEEDADQPSRRERRWRATTHFTTWNSADFLDDVGGQEAMRVFERQRIDFTVRQLQRWYAERRQWPRGWSAVEIDHDDVLHLRMEDLAGLKREMDALLDRYRAVERDADDEDAARVLVLSFAFPVTEVDL